VFLLGNLIGAMDMISECQQGASLMSLLSPTSEYMLTARMSPIHEPHIPIAGFEPMTI